MSVSAPRVLYIGGEGRSGSTLLGGLLGQVPGVFFGGELREVWEWGVGRNALCGCGVAFLDCPLWTEVGGTFGGWDRVDLDVVRALAARVDRSRRIPGMLRPSAARPGGRGVGAYLDLVRRLHRAVAMVTGASVVVDSSKHPASAFVLRAAGFDVRAVHLIRDSRGVAHSWSRLVVRRDAGRDEVQMHRFPPGRIAARWVGRNLLMELLSATGTPTERIRYEDLVARPAESVGRLLDLAGMGGDRSVAAMSDGSVELRPNHTVMGNPVRMRTGPVALRLDDGWRSAMPARPRRVVTAVTWPLLRRYGYGSSRPSS